MKQKKKKKQDRLSIEELLSASHWGGFVATLPPEVQRLALQALEAYDKKNYRRMEQLSKQILKESQADESLTFDVFRILWVELLNGKGFFEKAKSVLNDLVEREEARGEDESLDSSAFAESTGVEDVWMLLGLKHIRRLEQYKFMLADSYIDMGDYEKAADIYESLYPFCERTADVCYIYLNILAKLGREDDALALTDGIIDRYGKPHENGKIYQSDAAIICKAYSVKITCALDKGDVENADKAIDHLLAFVHSLTEDLKHGSFFMHILGETIVYVSVQAERGVFREPFRKFLDEVSAENIYDGEHDNYDEFSDLLPSGYRVLERYEYEKDERLHRFVAGMLIDIVSHATTLQDVGRGLDENSKVAYFEIMGMLSARWYLFRFCSESDDNLEEFKRNLNVIENSYPHIWDVLGREVEGMTMQGLDFHEGMNALLSEIIKRNRGRKSSWAQMRDGMEQGYKATWKKEMGDD